jgi:hypothetical protein
MKFRIPVGFSISAAAKEKRGVKGFPVWSWCLEVNAPFDEPNRLYLHGRGWWAILGLPSCWSMRITEQLGDSTFNAEYFLTWPHIDGCARSNPPRRGEWGWLTVSRD